ncbi:hypothetical protein ACVXRV_003484 [Enterobacter roggenkampii]|uniref:hypothetical protein n=1 Tax=Enterobacter roggenkampii TaxID=1812935 RepID=UPI001C5BE825|nr:hypothetical protein [Enterobacter roggenkampii]MBW4236948.1 hypothetical protein [Enterobacter roggenkampii]
MKKPLVRRLVLIAWLSSFSSLGGDFGKIGFSILPKYCLTATALGLYHSSSYPLSLPADGRKKGRLSDLSSLNTREEIPVFLTIP